MEVLELKREGDKEEGKREQVDKRRERGIKGGKTDEQRERGREISRKR